MRNAFGRRIDPLTVVLSAGCLLLALANGEAVGAMQAQEAQLPFLFASHDTLSLTITADVRALDDDRRSSPDRPAVFTLPALGSPVGEGVTIDVPGEVRTRGAFRLDPGNCSFPQLRLDVDGDDADGTALEGQDKLKLVSSCRPGRNSYDELVRLEYLVYRTHALVADATFRVRWIRLTLVDEGGVEEPLTRGGFLIEEDDALAERFGAEVFDLEEGKNLPRTGLDPTSMLSTALFQYMVGNLDWSAVAGHNVELLDRGGAAIVVPYDFDFTGVVDAPYATPPAAFQLSSVRERVYRGWCANPVLTAAALQRFRSGEEAVLTLWRETPGLADDTRRRVISYMEEFFDAIETDERANRRFLRDCRS
jgi:hypothetical protein